MLAYSPYHHVVDGTAYPAALFLTGDKPYIWSLCQDGFKLPVAESTKSVEPITHSSRLVLVDKTGTVRGTYEGVGDEGSKRMVADIRRLLTE